ncbi:MAG: hypothetical protein ACP5D2_03775 [Candidatus Nanoarchaeia archaeon]
MRFKQQLEDLKQLNLSNDKFAIFGSGCLAVRGIRDSNDIDIIVKEDLWKDLLERYGEYRKGVIKIGNIEVCQDFSPCDDNCEELIDDCDIFEGLRFVKLVCYPKISS